MSINKALLKYGYSSFRLEILEYCDPMDAVKREQDYIDLLAPEYNILKIAGSLLGYKHSEETLKKFRNRKHSEQSKKLMSEINLGKNNPRFGKTHTEETKALLRAARLGKVLSESAKTKMSVDKGTAIKVFDKEMNVTSTFSSITRAAEGLGVTRQALLYHFKKSSSFLFKGRYQIEKINS